MSKNCARRWLTSSQHSSTPAGLISSLFSGGIRIFADRVQMTNDKCPSPETLPKFFRRGKRCATPEDVQRLSICRTRFEGDLSAVTHLVPAVYDRSIRWHFSTTFGECVAHLPKQHPPLRGKQECCFPMKDAITSAMRPGALTEGLGVARSPMTVSPSRFRFSCRLRGVSPGSAGDSLLCVLRVLCGCMNSSLRTRERDCIRMARWRTKALHSLP